MSIAKVIEVIGEGKTVEDAVDNIVKEVEETLKNVKQVNVRHIQALVENAKVTKYRVNADVTFVVKH
jgi:dodecin